MLGIGIITFNRFGGCFACCESIACYTRTPHQLIIADDGSQDGTAEHARRRGWNVVDGVNRGVAWNVNRALYALRDCDPIVLLDSDIWPTEPGWERPWIEAAQRWGHVNYAFESPPPVSGSGVPDDPFRCEAFGSGVVATTRAAFQLVGYQDPRFYDFKFSIAHAEWTFRFERALRWDRLTQNSTPPCLRHGIKVQNLGTYYQSDLVTQSSTIVSQTICEAPYRFPWRNDGEQAEFLADQAK